MVRKILKKLDELYLKDLENRRSGELIGLVLANLLVIIAAIYTPLSLLKLALLVGRFNIYTYLSFIFSPFLGALFIYVLYILLKVLLKRRNKMHQKTSKKT